MSDETTPGRRPYRKRRRADREAETRLRITEAAVELHGSLGPARTTISAVAERAGVQRGTVYRHFPDEEALFAACSSHWLEQHPLPDLAGWAAIASPRERLGTALRDLYRWYGGAEPMLERTLRDAPLVPAMSAPVAALSAWTAAAAEAIAQGRPERDTAMRRVRAAVGHAVAFTTWRSLVRDQGLAPDEAVGLMEDLVAAAAG